LLITSFQNPRVKYLRSLRLRKYRQRENRFLVEGIRIVEEALDRGAAVETLVYAPDLLVSERAQALVERVDSSQRLALSGEVFASLSDRDQPQGIAALIRIEALSLVHVPLVEDLLVVVAHQLSDPGNLGSIIRTADSAGATGLVIVEPSVDLYDPQTVRATMGSLFALPIVRLAGDGLLAPWYGRVRASGSPLLVVGTSAHGAQLYYDVDYRRPLVLLLGSERQGLPEPMRQQADVVVRLPMSGTSTSLNVSAAAAALIYEVVRQRSSTGPGGLN
jgi:TrmH family RNA methyltransferase